MESLRFERNNADLNAVTWFMASKNLATVSWIPDLGPGIRDTGSKLLEQIHDPESRMRRSMVMESKMQGMKAHNGVSQQENP